MAGSSRPKGYIYDWKPQTKTIILLNQIQGILDSYSDHLPMTARQIFYRLVGVYDYDKTEQAYSRLCELLVKARRAGKKEMRELIRDLHHTVANAPANMEFAAKSLTEHVEKVVTKARADVEAMAAASGGNPFLIGPTSVPQLPEGDS